MRTEAETLQAQVDEGVAILAALDQLDDRPGNGRFLSDWPG